MGVEGLSDREEQVLSSIHGAWDCWDHHSAKQILDVYVGEQIELFLATKQEELCQAIIAGTLPQLKPTIHWNPRSSVDENPFHHLS